MKKLLILFLVFSVSQIIAQDNFKIEANAGVFAADLVTTLFSNEQRPDRFFGAGSVLSGNFYYSHDLVKKFYLDYGIGYSHYYFLYSETAEDYLPYLTFKIVANYKSFIKKTDLTLGLTNHILLLENLFGGIYGRRRFFSNLDLGFCFHPGKNWDLKLTTPLTVIYMNKAEVGSFNGPLVKNKVGVTGINLGLVYKFGGNKE